MLVSDPEEQPHPVMLARVLGQSAPVNVDCATKQNCAACAGQRAVSNPYISIATRKSPVVAYMPLKSSHVIPYKSPGYTLNIRVTPSFVGVEQIFAPYH